MVGAAAGGARGGIAVRRRALDLLGRIRRDEAYANLVLARSGEPAALDESDRALLTRLVYGTLQMEGSLDAALERASARGRLDVPPPVLDALRLGAYQLLFMDIPSHAAVGETVAAVRLRPVRRWRGLVNAVLRALADDRKSFPWLERSEDPVRWLAVRYGHPVWLVERLIAAYGEGETEALLAADNEPPKTHLRVNTLAATREGLLASLVGRGYAVSMAPDPFFDGLVVDGPPGVWHEPDAGHAFIVQDLGSQMAATLLAPRSGERVLDAACGRGGKTTHLATLMRNEGKVLAVDVSETKVRQTSELACAMGVSVVEALPGDARTWRPPDGELFDAVLLDAPCSGSGTLRRRAELRWRLSPTQLEEVKRLQRELLSGVGALVRPGGRLVYATCSILPEENMRQVEWLLADGRAHPFTLTQHRQLLPHRHGTDGHFAARLVRAG